MRRALGFKLTSHGPRLIGFVRLLRGRAMPTRVTTELALEWATGDRQADRRGLTWARRLDVVRIFARHLQSLDPATEVPPADVLTAASYRRPALPLLRRGGRRADERGQDAAARCRAVTWRTLHRPAGGDRHAAGRGMPPRPRRRRPGRR